MMPSSRATNHLMPPGLCADDVASTMGMQVGSVGGDEATSQGSIDTGCQVVCEVGLHHDHFSVAASQDGRFVATCRQGGWVNMNAQLC
eukprot:1158895-Pelagomonas_calceolata.AAC.2